MRRRMGPVVYAGEKSLGLIILERSFQYGINIQTRKALLDSVLSKGKPYQERSKSTKETDAKRLLKKRGGEISDGKLPGIYFDKVTYDELKTELLTDYDLNGRKSLERVKISLQHLDKDFQSVKVMNIDTTRISGHKTRSVFERYNIVSDSDLMLAAQRQEAFLKAQKVTNTVTIEKIGAASDLQPLDFMVVRAVYRQPLLDQISC